MKINWSTKKLSDIVEKLKLTKAPIGSWPYIEIGDINVKNKTITLKDKKSIKGAIIASGDSVIVSRVRPTRGAITLIKKNYVISSAFTVLKANQLETSSRFLFYWLGFSGSFLTYLQRKQKGSNYPSIREYDILNFKIPLPPLSIQQKIVERLDAIRKAQELNEKQISLANELFQSLLHQELKPTKIWRVKKLGEVCEVNPKTNLDLSKEKVKYVEMAAIDEDLKEIQYFLDRPTDKVSSGASKFRNGDVIFARITPCTENGKVAFVEDCHEACAGSTELHILRAKQKEVLSHFLFYCLIKPRIKNMAVANMTGSTGRQRVPAEFFRYLKIPLPSLKTQRQIVEKLTTVQDYKKKLLKQKELFQELFESTLNKAMKGELV